MLLTWAFLILAISTFALAIALLVWGALNSRRPQSLQLHITQRSDHPNDWFTLILRRPWYARALPLPRFRAGQSVAISLSDDQTKSTLRRRYSLARWESLPFRYEITVKREPLGKFTNLLAKKAQLNTKITVELPSGDFILPAPPSTPRAVLIAGGVGITPLLAMLDQYLNEESSFQEVFLYWQVRFEHEWIYREILQEHALRDPRIRVRLLASKGLHGNCERISIAMLKQELKSFSDVTFLMCASQSMLDDLSVGLQANAVPIDAILFERFALGATHRETGLWQLAIEGKNISFQGQPSLLDALEDGGVNVASDCRTGVCGQCRLNLLSGSTHNLVRPEFDVAAGQVLACCCIPQSDLTLSPA